jgi:hypothetical protein
MAVIACALSSSIGRAATIATVSGEPARTCLSAESRTTAAPLDLLAHLDEESVPSAENPGSSLTGSSTPAPDENPGQSEDWERLPSTGAGPSGAPASSANPVGPASGAPMNQPPAPVSKEPPPRTSATDAHPDNPNPSATTNLATAPTGAGVRTASFNIKSPTASSQPQAAPIAASANTASASTADPNTPAAPTLHGTSVANAGDANAGPPPALDLGSMQSAPDLAATSLDGEIKKADTPARMAALRVTEQARVELQAGRTDEAMRDLGRAVSIDPGNPFEYFYLGRAYIARRNYHQALTFLERAEIGFAARPDWLGADVGLEGDCYEELGQNTDAVLAYRRALGTAPNNLTARVGYSRLASYLPAPPSSPSVDASADPTSSDEVSPPPRADATVPAPNEPQPPPPPVSNMQQSAPKQVLPADSSQD